MATSRATVAPVQNPIAALQRRGQLICLQTAEFEAIGRLLVEAP
jgi:hypothetical protein